MDIFIAWNEAGHPERFKTWEDFHEYARDAMSAIDYHIDYAIEVKRTNMAIDFHGFYLHETEVYSPTQVRRMYDEYERNAADDARHERSLYGRL